MNLFKKALVVEDFDSVGISVKAMLVEEFGIKEIVYVKYCEEAYLKLQKAYQDKKPFELMVSDLSFAQDHRSDRFQSGKDLIEMVHGQFPDLRIIVFSVEDRIGRIKMLLSLEGVYGYVLKGRNGLAELKKAVLGSFHGKVYEPNIVQQSNEGTFQLQDYDVSLLEYLSSGYSQCQIAEKFQFEGLSPNSLSSVEKRLNKLKQVFNANNNVSLVANAKDIGII